jgi:hypothetical protein
MFPPESCSLEFQYGKALAGFEVALAAKPVFHGRLEAIERNAAAGFEQAVGGGERVVKTASLVKLRMAKLSIHWMGQG